MIFNFKSYCESISGTELVGPVGPNYGDTTLPVKLNSLETEIICSDINGELYTKDDYDQMYGDYLKKSGKPLIGFNKKNLEEVINFLQKAN